MATNHLIKILKLTKLLIYFTFEVFNILVRLVDDFGQLFSIHHFFEYPHLDSISVKLLNIKQKVKPTQSFGTRPIHENGKGELDYFNLPDLSAP